jgi:hypothetical protein
LLVQHLKRIIGFILLKNIFIFVFLSKLLLGGGKATQNKVKIVLLKVNEEKLRKRVAYRERFGPKHFASSSLISSQLEEFEVDIFL